MERRLLEVFTVSRGKAETVCSSKKPAGGQATSCSEGSYTDVWIELALTIISLYMLYIQAGLLPKIK
jgi:hypothetical protein